MIRTRLLATLSFCVVLAACGSPIQRQQIGGKSVAPSKDSTIKNGTNDAIGGSTANGGNTNGNGSSSGGNSTSGSNGGSNGGSTDNGGVAGGSNNGGGVVGGGNSAGGAVGGGNIGGGVVGGGVTGNGTGAATTGGTGQGSTTGGSGQGSTTGGDIGAGTSGTNNNGQVPGTNLAKGPGAYANDFKTNGSFFSRMTKSQQGSAAHGQIWIWYTTNIKDLISQAQFVVPEGTVAIVETQIGAVKQKAVMVKKAAGFDAPGNDWSYEMRDDTGTLLQSPVPGKNATCTSCHAAAKAKDFLAGTDLKDLLPQPTPAPEVSDRGPGFFDPNFKASGSFFSNMSAPAKGSSPHGTVQVWYSNNAKDVLGGSAFVVPPGTIAVKEFDVNHDNTVDGVAVMIKMDRGYDKTGNDWHYEVRDTFGALVDNPPAGRIARCVNCHAAAKATDYLAATKLGTPPVPKGAGPGVFRHNYYWSQDFFTFMRKPQASNTPHKNIHIWYSSNIKDTLVKGTAPFVAPVGTVAIKRFVHADTGERGLAVMIKQAAGYDTANNDWRYEMRDAYGNLKAQPEAGKIQACITCHQAHKDRDFLPGSTIKN